LVSEGLVETSVIIHKKIINNFIMLFFNDLILYKTERWCYNRK